MSVDDMSLVVFCCHQCILVPTCPFVVSQRENRQRATPYTVQSEMKIRISYQTCSGSLEEIKVESLQIDTADPPNKWTVQSVNFSSFVSCHPWSLSLSISMQSHRRRSCLPKFRLFKSRERCKWPTTAWAWWFTKKKKKMTVFFILWLTTSCAWRWWAQLFYAIFPCKNFLQSCLFGVLGQQTVVYLTLTFSLSLLDDAKSEDGLCGKIFFENPLFCSAFPYAVPTVCAHKRST